MCGIMAKFMRIAVLNMTGGGSSGGYKKYLSAILPRLAARPEITEILCASPASLGAEAWLAGIPRIKFTECEPFRFMRHVPEAGLMAVMDRFRPDLVFVSLERYIRYRDVPVVTVVHNMAPLSGVKVSSGILDKTKCLAQFIETRMAVKNSAAVIAPTEYVRNFLIKKWKLENNRVTTINFGVSPAPKDSHPPAGMAVPGRFIFTAGSLEVYRGIEDIIQAMPGLKKTFPGLKLLTAGETRPATAGYLRNLHKRADGLGIADDIVWLGNLSEEELSWCYRNCAAFVMTSRVESFGFTALEAMQYGCNCVSTDSPCLPEIFRDCALYYTYGDIPGLSKAVSEVLAMNVTERGRFGAMGRHRASGFSWDEAAERTAEVLSKAAQKGPAR